MDYVMYLDESGNTGNPRFKEKGWNFTDQPNYGLGAICLKKSKENELIDEILKLFSKYDNELGRSKELKAKNEYYFRNDLLCELTRLLEKFDVIFYFDIISKRFNIVKYLVHYCLYPESIIDLNDLTLHEKVSFATLVYNNVDDEQLQEFIELCQLDTESEGLREKYIEFLIKLKMCVNDKSILKRIEKGSETFENKNIPLKKLLPIEDYTNKGRLIRLLPNIDSFNNVFVSIAALKLSPRDNVILYHDIQDQFGKSYERWIFESLRLGLTNVEKIEFINSKDSVLIQTIDFLIGNLMSLYESTVSNSMLKRSDREIGKKINIILNNTNIVSTKYDQYKFFTSHGIKFAPTKKPL